MDKREIERAVFVIGLFSLGAIALILYQHSVHTGQIIGAINGPSASKTAPAAIIANAQANPSAGAITPGQDNQVPDAPNPDLLAAGSNYEFDNGNEW